MSQQHSAVAPVRTTRFQQCLRSLWAVLVFMLLQLGGAPLAQAQTTDFDHASTGFVLNGQHQNVRCETCHVKGVFKGTPKDCASCHGWNNPRATTVMPTNHIPMGTVSCENCHAANQSQFVDATATFSHALVVGQLTCNSCHSSRQPHPNVRANPADPTHLAVLNSGTSCEQCHSTLQFTGPKMPVNHIPTAKVACSVCHTATDYSDKPSMRAIHAFAPAANTNCQLCHSNSAAAYYSRPGMTIVSAPANHIAMNAQSCEVCHVGAGSSVQLPVVDGAHFANSQFSHSGIRSGCANCHGPNVDISSGNFFGIGSMVLMPPSNGPGAASHIPGFATCETCHSANIPTGLLSVNAAHAIPGSGFMLPAPTAAMIHAGVSGNCASCHEAGYVWLGVNQYTSRKTAPYSGFQTRPVAGGDTYAVDDAAHPAGECSNCHSVGSAFVATAAPGNHIPYAASAACSSCHKAGNFSTLPALADIHANLQSISSNCQQCHSATNAARYAMPTLKIVAPPTGHIADVANVGCEGCHVGTGSSIAATPVPNGALFSNSAFNHSGIASGCASCHGPNVNPGGFYGISRVVVMPPTSPPSANSHLPTTSSCENCHTVAPSGLIPASAPSIAPGSTGFYTLYTPTAAQIHAGATGTCSSCHEAGYVWRGVDKYTITRSAPYTGFQTRPLAGGGTYAVDDAAHPATGNCSNCHGSQIDFNVSVAPANHIPVAAGAACAACHKNPDYSVMPSMTDIHANAPSTSTGCAQCHSQTNAAIYNAMASMRPPIVSPPTGHIAMGNLGCEACHVGAGSSIATTPVVSGAKFSGSLFSHSGITNGCDTCHGASVTAGSFYGIYPKTISSLSPVHVPTSAACESCHTNNIPSMLVPAPGMTTFAGALFSHSGISSGCDTCHGPSVSTSAFYGVRQIVMPPSAVPGTSSHLPTSTTCESCHLGSLPASPVAAVAVKSIPNTDFRQPPPTASQIHTGVTGNCSSCHDTGYVWVGMDLYPISPAVLTTGANYTGFQTRPQATASTFNVNDSLHPGSGDCSSCHGGFTNFNGPSMPANHIPTAAACSACHKSTSYSVMPSTTDIHANIASTSSGCANCHSEANAATYNTMANMVPKIVSPPGGHIDMGGAGCETCHVGAGSSMASTPVLNGAKFSGSLFNHQGATASCSSCHGMLVGAGTFFGVTPKSMGSLSPAHVPVSNSTTCDTCHVNSVPTGLVPSAGMRTFAGAQFSHSGITSDCATCHGPNITGSSFYGISSIVVMPPSAGPGINSHIPSGTVCENCHLGSTPSGLVPGVAPRGAPNSGFLSPAPTQAMIHSGISGNCSTCHETNMVWMSMNVYPARQTAPYTGFQTRPQQNSSGLYFVRDASHPTGGDCSNCHGSTSSEFASPSKPANHIPSEPTATCTACHTSPDFSVMPTLFNIHANAPMNGACADCHSAAKAAFYAMPSMSPALVGVPAKHIDMGSLGCEGCHVGANSSLRVPVQNGAKFSNSAFSHTGITTGCASCHGATVNSSTFYGITPKTIASLTPAHVPVSASMACEVCHTNAVPSTLIPLSGAGAGMTTFAGAQFSHSGITTGCAACHGQGITGSTFYGVSKIVVMPPSTASGVNSHLPTSSTCENCHLGSTPSTLVPGVAPKAAPGSGFLAPTPTASMIHAGATGTCTTCHETNMVWMSMGQYPITTTAPFKGFQTRPQTATSGTFFVQDAAHPASGNCSNCHASMADFTASAVPANHIPIKTGALCTACHTNVDFSVMPTIANIHLNAPSSSSNCAQCHSAANAANYNTMASMNPKIKTVSATHVDMGTLGCESCHITSGGVTSSMTLPVQNTAKFSNSAYSHSGVTTNCASCHGNAAAIPFDGVTPKSMAGLAPRHVPTTLACEVCHTSVPSVLIPLSGGTAPNTFAGGQFSHSGIVSGCDTCHGATITNSSFYGVTKIVVLPATSPTGTNAHIPSPINAQCEACHLGSTPSGLVPAVSTTPTLGSTKFKLPLPSGDMVHTGVNAACNNCHEKGMSWLGVSLYPRTAALGVSGTAYTGFQARPYAGGSAYSINDASHPTGSGDCSQCHGSTTSFRVDAMPSNHIPVKAVACNVCHTATNPLDFSVLPTLADTHTYAATGSTCATCHSVTNAAKYAIPANGFAIKAPDAKHVPFGATACETCHVGNGSSMPTTTVANGAKFSGSLYSHSGVTTGCVTCHGPSITSTSFTGITGMVVAPKTSPQGITSHIPYTAACEVCHAASTPSALVAVNVTKTLPGSGFRLPKPTGPMIHANSSGFSCMSCHEANYRWMGVDLYPISPTVVTTGASYTGFQTRPIAAATPYSVADAQHAVGGLATGDCALCHSGTTAFTAAGLPAGHMPTKGSSCATCHGADYSVATLIKTGIHTGITGGLVTYSAATIGTKTCVTCHTVGTGGTSGTAPFTGCATQANCSSPPPQNAYQPMLKDAKGAHVPIGTTDCNGCHASFTAFSGMDMKPGSQVPHNNAKFGGVKCLDCHELGMSWFGVTTLKVRVASKHTTTARKPPNDCSNSGCHDLGGFRALLRPVMREALVSPDMGRIRPTLQTSKPSRGSLGNSFDHKGVAVGQCKTCHDGKSASGMPARHLMVTQSCDTCHRTTTWTPAQFNHSGVSPNTCQVCHNGMGATGKPSGHFMSARSCDSCHKNMNLGWKPVMYQHLSPSYKPSPDMLNCVSCHITNGEIIPRQMRGLTRTKPIPLGQ